MSFQLSDTPDALYDRVLTHPSGSLDERVLTINGLRQALLQGEWPKEQLPWISTELQAALQVWMEERNFLYWCQGNETVVDEWLLNLCDLMEELLRKSIKRQRAWNQSSEKASLQQKLETLENKTLSAETYGKLFVLLVLLEVLSHWIEALDVTLSADQQWNTRIEQWEQLESIFGPIGRSLGLGWDLSKGILNHVGWGKIQQLEKLLQDNPHLAELLQILGRLRMQETDDDESGLLSDVFESLSRVEEELRDRVIPKIPQYNEGVERSQDFMRMLPSEAMLRLRPGLKRLWQAKWAERSLMTYRREGFITEATQREFSEDIPLQQIPQRGPIITCLDTSGSMLGQPELIAKALVLSAAKVAYRENRQFYLYEFSDSYEGKELSLSPDGLEKLLDFMTTSFTGGTEVEAPLMQALNHQREAEWQRADILLVSDGGFSSPSNQLLEAIAEAKTQHRLRVAGLLISKGTSSAMEQICDPCRRFDDWSHISL